MSTQTFPFSVVTAPQIASLLEGHLDEAVQRVREAYLLHREGKTVNPNSHFLRFPDQPRNRIIALPAYLGGATAVSGLKWIASYPENVGKGFPRASAALLLNDPSTGYPFACLEASIISAARTACSAALAAQTLQPEGRRAKALGIVGTGLIAAQLYRTLEELGWEIDEVRLCDLKPADATGFATEVVDSKRHALVLAPCSLEETLSKSDLVAFTTTAAKPFVESAALLAHAPTVLHLSLRDLAPELLLSSQNIVDDVDHVLQAATSCHLAFQKTGGKDFIDGTLADFLLGRKRPDFERPRIFSPFGMGILDLALGRWIHDLAGAKDELHSIPDFFGEMGRYGARA